MAKTAMKAPKAMKTMKAMKAAVAMKAMKAAVATAAGEAGVTPDGATITDVSGLVAVAPPSIDGEPWNADGDEAEENDDEDMEVEEEDKDEEEEEEEDEEEEGDSHDKEEPATCGGDDGGNIADARSAKDTGKGARKGKGQDKASPKPKPKAKAKGKGKAKAKAKVKKGKAKSKANAASKAMASDAKGRDRGKSRVFSNLEKAGLLPQTVKDMLAKAPPGSLGIRVSIAVIVTEHPNTNAMQQPDLFLESMSLMHHTRNTCTSCAHIQMAMFPPRASRSDIGCYKLIRKL